jgi:hypothetical protein
MAKAPSNKVNSGDIQDLAIAVEQLTEETRILRQAIDELRDDVVWAARQVQTAGHTVARGYLSGRQRDPFAPNFELHHRDRPAANMEHVATDTYCCDQPKLGWNGDPDAPGIACDNCRFVVAQAGSTAIWHDGQSEDQSCENFAPVEQRRRKLQGTLFDESK